VPQATTHYDSTPRAAPRASTSPCCRRSSRSHGPSAAGQPLALTWRTSSGTKLTLSARGDHAAARRERPGRIAAVRSATRCRRTCPSTGCSATPQLEAGRRWSPQPRGARRGALKLSQLVVPEYVRHGQPYNVDLLTSGRVSRAVRDDQLSSGARSGNHDQARHAHWLRAATQRVHVV